MPQNPTQVLVGLNSGSPKAIAVDANGVLLNSTPTTVTVTNANAAIAADATFQEAAAANAARLPGGAILNNSTSKTLQVFFGVTADAKSAESFVVPVSSALKLTEVFGANQTYLGAIQVAGTKAETFGVVQVTAAS